MDTLDIYLDDKFYVVMAGEKPDEKFRLTSRGMSDQAEGAIVKPAREKHYLGEQPPVDGWVTFYNPDLLEQGEPFKHGTFPFRDYRTDGLWFAKPDEDEWSKHPIWKWQNPEEDPHSNLTLKPSIGKQDGKITFHCHIRNGEIKWI